VLGRAGGALETAAGLMIIAMMAVTTLDVVGRYFFNRPLWGAFETIEILMGLVVFAGMPLAAASRENIVIDLLEGVMSYRARCLLTVVADLVAAGVAALLAWRVGARAIQLHAVGETTMQLQIGRFWVAGAMSILATLAALVLLRAAWSAWRAARDQAAATT
jgi:TRAP-type C4-dicarboxylate transport system permease small subunit